MTQEAVEAAPRVPAAAPGPVGLPVSRAERAVGTTVLRGLGLLLLVTACGALLAPRDPNIVYDRRFVLAGLVVSGVLAALLVRWAGPVLRRAAAGATGWVVAAVVAVLGGLGGVWLAHWIEYHYGWDAGAVTGLSGTLWSTGVLPRWGHDYLSRYPNNVPLVGVMNLARTVGQATGTDMYRVLVWLNGICLGVVLLLVFVLVRMLRGPAAGWGAQLLVLVLVGASPWMAVPYTDLLAMPFVIGGVTLAIAAVRVRPSGRRHPFAASVGVVALAAGAFALLAVGYVVKTIPATTAVALGLAVGVVALRRPTVRGVAALLAALAGAALAFGGVATLAGSAAYSTARIEPTQLDPTLTPPTAWWAAMALTLSSPGGGRYYYGSYSATMVHESYRLRGPELAAWSEARLGHRLQTMGVGGVLAFEANKQVFNWGDGMFFAWGEGRDTKAPRFVDHSPFAAQVQSWDHPSGSHYALRAGLANGLWLGLLLWAGAGLLVATYRRDRLVMALAVLGVTAFTLVFQGRSRYLLAYVPLVVALAMSVDATAVLRHPAGPLGRLRARVSGPRAGGTGR